LVGREVEQLLDATLDEELVRRLHGPRGFVQLVHPYGKG
jgi:hypothetical protein